MFRLAGSGETRDLDRGDDVGGEVGDGREEVGSRHSGDGDKSLVFDVSSLKLINISDRSLRARERARKKGDEKKKDTHKQARQTNPPSRDLLGTYMRSTCSKLIGAGAGALAVAVEPAVRPFLALRIAAGRTSVTQVAGAEGETGRAGDSSHDFLLFS